MPMYVNARDYPTVAEAISAVSYGGKLFCPADEKLGPYVPPDQNGWIINKPIEIYGESRVNEWTGFQYFNAGGDRKTSDSTVFQLKTGANHFYLHDVAISGAVDRLPGTGDGIRFEQPGSVIWGTVLERVGILYAGRYGINFASPDSPDATGYEVAPSFKDVTVYGAKSHGIYFRNTTAVSMIKVSATQCGGTGFYCHSVNGSFDGCTAEGNGWGLTGPQDASNMYIEDSAAISMHGWHFEDFGHDLVSKTALVMSNCRGFTISGNLFEAPGERGMLLRGCKNVQIGSNAHFGLKTMIELDSTSSAITILPQHHEPWGAGQLGKIIVPSGHKNFIFPQINDNDNRSCGISFPEVNGSSEVKNPRNGLVIYDKNAGRLKYYHSGSWRTVRVS